MKSLKGKAMNFSLDNPFTQAVLKKALTRYSPAVPAPPKKKLK
jgi:hypothetical protein